MKDKEIKRNYIKLISIMVIHHFGPPKPSPKHECNHIDGDKSNNWSTNLEWLTHKENVQHAFDINLATPCLGEAHGYSKLTKRQVKAIRNECIPHKITFKILSKKYKVSKSCIRDIINGKSWGWL